MNVSDEIKNGTDKVDEKTNELIMEFHSHYEEYIKLRPEDKDRKDEIFQAWIIQKIAGIQVGILELVESLNSFIKTSHYHQEKEVITSGLTRREEAWLFSVKALVGSKVLKPAGYPQGSGQKTEGDD